MDKFGSSTPLSPQFTLYNFTMKRLIKNDQKGAPSKNILQYGQERVKEPLSSCVRWLLALVLPFLFCVPFVILSSIVPPQEKENMFNIINFDLFGENAEVAPSNATEIMRTETTPFGAQSVQNNDKPFLQEPVQTESNHKKKLLFLNATDASTLVIGATAKAKAKQEKGQNLPYTIDVLIIGSKNNIDQAKVQRETWASHEAVRHFILSTEYDNVGADEECKNDNPLSSKQLSQALQPCNNKYQFWREENARSILSDFYSTNYARQQWLEKKSNPKGWLCVQRRFITSFTRIVELYYETKSLPDYFILADDDTYINIDHIVKQMIVEPEELRAKGIHQDMMEFPTVDVPVVTAGCRVRAPDQMLTLLSPYGGYGTFFSRGALERLIEPIPCRREDIINKRADNNSSSKLANSAIRSGNIAEDQQSCAKLLHKAKYAYPMSATIAEEKYFKVGDSLNQVFYKYSREVKIFCLHSDWFIGYIANFHNVSRHQTLVGGDEYFDKRKMNVTENRLHSLPNSEIYRAHRPGGFCKYGDKLSCVPGATVCHRMNSTTLKKIHFDSLLLQK
mmetsp:Transcript_12453/g.18713  ORF Transcript_12453/g.18713 Transcript_12453/m.18713 type:complete len:564 (+) Transcript_12453:29-1720(+)